MQTRDDLTGEALENVARIHPVVDRLRDLLTSATLLDLKASSRGYWARESDDEERGVPSPGTA